MIGIADCNNFFASCERVFRPDLTGRPIVVLSNNDGCIIARSNEAKALGYKMGDPFFKVKDKLEREEVAVFSSNYTLYGDMSRRVMSMLSTYTPNLENYSIDESFLDLDGVVPPDELQAYGQRIAREVHRGTGIPISVGISTTRTLAKMASKFAKKYPAWKGCCIIDTEEKRRKACSLFDIADVWGVGRQSRETMHYLGVHTALDLADKHKSWVKQHFSLPMVRTWMELNGMPSISVDELPQKQSICTSRSFPDQGVSNHDSLLQSVANFASACVDKLRRQGSVCGAMTIFAYTSRFHTDGPTDVIQRSIQFTVSTCSQQEIVSTAVRTMREELKSFPFLYKKAGVILWNISTAEAVQQDLFDTVNRAQQARLAKAMDAINNRMGHNAVRMAVQGIDFHSGLKHEHESRRYTTNLQDIIQLNCK